MTHLPFDLVEKTYLRVRVQAADEGLDTESLDLFFNELEDEMDYLLE